MFTGIITNKSSILSVEAASISKTAKRISLHNAYADLVLGESIAVDGACLTVMAFDNERFWVEVSPETLRLTRTDAYAAGTVVNLERALRLGDRLGGHFVQGHVDQMASVSMIRPFESFIEFEFTGVARSNLPFLFKKGSVTVNGVSLTVNEVTDDRFRVMLIPHTLEETNLSSLQVGDCVNLEFDWLVKCVVNTTKSREFFRGDDHGTK